MFAVPTLTPVKFPLASTFATEAFELLQTPPLTVGVNDKELPTQDELAKVKSGVAGNASTVNVVVNELLQPAPLVTL